MKKENEIIKEDYKAPFIEMVEVRVEKGFGNSPSDPDSGADRDTPGSHTW